MRIYVCRPIPQVGLDMLKKQGFEVVVNPDDRVLSAEELKKAVKGADAVLSLLTDHIDEAALEAAGPQLRIVANYAVGFDNVDVAAAKKRGVLVTNTPGVLSQAVAEHAWALILAAARRVAESDRFVRQGKYRQWEPMGFLGPELAGQTLGVVGLGRIGSKVAAIGRRGFKMNIIYSDIKPNPDFEKEFQAVYADVDEVLKMADVVSLHVPLLASTRHLINSERLDLMKQTAILVNTSRGPIVDEKALVEALKNRKIFAAGLDVYENEPRLTEGLGGLDNVVLTSHIASATTQAREAMARMAAQNIIDALSGKTPPNLLSGA